MLIKNIELKSLLTPELYDVLGSASLGVYFYNHLNLVEKLNKFDRVVLIVSDDFYRHVDVDFFYEMLKDLNNYFINEESLHNRLSITVDKDCIVLTQGDIDLFMSKVIPQLFKAPEVPITEKFKSYYPLACLMCLFISCTTMLTLVIETVLRDFNVRIFSFSFLGWLLGLSLFGYALFYHLSKNSN